MGTSASPRQAKATAGCCTVRLGLAVALFGLAIVAGVFLGNASLNSQLHACETISGWASQIGQQPTSTVLTKQDIASCQATVRDQVVFVEAPGYAIPLVLAAMIYFVLSFFPGRSTTKPAAPTQ